MKLQIIHSSDPHKVDGIWLMLGGRITPVRRTGEKRYRHDQFESPLTVNGRRHDVPAKLISRLNQIIRKTPAP